MGKKTKGTLLATLILLISLTRPAHGYIDPGSGSFFIQMLLGVLLGGAFMIKTFWGRIKESLSELIGSKEETNE